MALPLIWGKLHQLIYADLIKQIGEDQARLYAGSNQAAIEQIATFVAEQQIDLVTHWVGDRLKGLQSSSFTDQI